MPPDSRPPEEILDEVLDPEVQPTLPAATLAVAATVAAGDHLVAGRGPATTAEIWSLAWPVMLSQALATSIGLIDIAMVGRLGPLHVAAVGYASQFFFMAQSAFFAIGFACVALMARAIGGGDRARARQSMLASLFAAVLTAATLTAIALSAPETFLRWLNAEPPVIALTIPYLRLLFASSLLLAVSITLENAMRADKNTTTPMRIAVVVTALKIALNAVLIFGLAGFPRLELIGAGLATLVSQVVAVVLFGSAIWFVRGPSSLAPVAGDFARSRALFGQVVRVALPGVGERIVLNMALLVYFAILGAYGSVAVAAYTVGVRVLAFSWIPGTGFGAAAATLVGQALGAGDPDGATRTGWLAARIALVTAAVLGLLCAFGRVPLARLFISDAATVATLGPFMLMLALAQPFMQVHFALAGAHRGAGDTWTPLLAATVGNWALRVPLAFLFGSFLGAELVWVWSALVFDHLARATWLAIAFRRGRWKRL